MRIAVGQMPGSRLDQWPQTLALIDELVDRATQLQADLILLPECAWPAYCLGSRAAYAAARRSGLPGPDELITHLQALARARRIAVCVGYVAETGQRLHNAAAVIGRDGRLCGRHDKCFLWDFDQDYFEVGGRIVPVDTEFGCVGVMVCADARLPEIPATLAARGATLLLQPTGWVNAGLADTLWNPQPDFLIRARAAEFGIPVASASKWGQEGGTTFVGASLLCDHDGQVLGQCGPAETTVIVADVQPRPPVLAPLTKSQCATLLIDAPVLPTASAEPLQIPLERRSASSGEITAHGAARVGWLQADDLRSFAPARCLALQGVHVLLVPGEAPLLFARARACENRVFLVSAESAGWRVIDPRGIVIHEHVARAELDVAAAATKTVAPRTDVICGRRPELFEFKAA